MRSLIITLIADDCPGLVDRLSHIILSFGGNWEESEMAHLAGKFAGILRVTVPAATSDALSDAILASRDWHALVEVDEVLGPETKIWQRVIEVAAQDQPGIVNRITAVLAQLGVNVEHFESRVESAPMSGEKIFSARMAVRFPESLEASVVESALVLAASDLMADISFPE